MAEQNARTTNGSVDESHVTVRIPAEHVEDFRKAIVEEIRWEAECIAGCKQGDTADVRSDAALMAHDVALFDQLAVAEYSMDGSATLLVEGLSAIESLPHVFESMCRKVLGPRLSDQLGYSPMGGAERVELGETMAGLSWAVDQAAEYHGKASEVRQGAARGTG